MASTPLFTPAEGAAADEPSALVVRKNGSGAGVGPRTRLNLVEGENVTITVADDVEAAEVDVTIAASGGNLGDVVGPASAADNALARFDSTTGKLLQNSAVLASDAGAVSGITQLDVDNLRLDGNVLSSTNANGNVAVTPNGTGQLTIPAGTVAAPGLAFTAAPDRGIWAANGATQFSVSGTSVAAVGLDYLAVIYNAVVGWSSNPSGSGPDAGLARESAAVVRVCNGSTGLGALLSGRPVEASVAGSGSPNLLAATEARKLITNEGATAEAYNTLPASAPVGYEQPFYCHDADGIRITAPTGCTIRLSPTQVSAAAGYVRSVVIGSGVVLTKINATEFVSVSAPNGTWTADS